MKALVYETAHDIADFALARCWRCQMAPPSAPAPAARETRFGVSLAPVTLAL